MNINKENGLNVIVTSDDELDLLKMALDYATANCLDGDMMDDLNKMLVVISDTQ